MNRSAVTGSEKSKKGGKWRKMPENKHVSQALINPLLLPLEMLLSVPPFTLRSLLKQNNAHYRERLNFTNSKGGCNDSREKYHFLHISFTVSTLE